MYLYNDFESTAATGTAISNANSGGPAGNAWDDTAGSGNGTSVYTTTSPLLGTRSGLFSQTSGSSSFARVGWTTSLGGTFTRMQGGCVVTPVTALPGAQASITRWLNTGTQLARLTLDPSGNITLRNSTSSQVATSTSTMTTSDTWYVAWDITFSASGSGTLYIYHSLASQTPDETHTFSAANFTSSPVNQVYFGQGAGQNATISVKLDWAVVTDSGTVPGPPVLDMTGSAPVTMSPAGTITTTAKMTGASSFVMAAAGALTVAGVVSMTGSAPIVMTPSGTLSINSTTVDMTGVGSFVMGASGVLSKPVMMTGAASFVMHATASFPEPSYLFTPPTEMRVAVLEGALRTSWLECATVWKTADGWTYAFYPTIDQMASATRLLAVPGTPQPVDADTAAELIAAGIGTVTTIA